MSLPDKTISPLHTYFAAMSRLIGVISLKRVLEIIYVQNDMLDFLLSAQIPRFMDFQIGSFSFKETEFISFINYIKEMGQHENDTLGENDLTEERTMMNVNPFSNIPIFTIIALEC